MTLQTREFVNERMESLTDNVEPQYPACLSFFVGRPSRMRVRVEMVFPSLQGL